MERKIGEIFDYEGKKLQVVEKNFFCDGCYFYEVGDDFCLNDDDFGKTGSCLANRSDQKEVIFQEVTN